jgi:hypothetical protein
MGLLTDPWSETISFKGHRYHVNAAFDTVLMVQQLYKDERLTDMDKVIQALRMLVRERIRVWCLPDAQKAELLQEVVKQHIELPKRPPSRKQTRLVDFDLDGDYIYASFRQAYGIDLLAEQGRLHWKRFIMLFQGLPENTKIREVMKIRGMDLPEPNKYNQKERQSLVELKYYYALPAVGGGGQQGLDALFSSLEARAI